MKRAERRHHRVRIKKRREFFVRKMLHMKGDVHRFIQALTNHGKPCSCYMCGNPRKHFGEETMQEKKAEKEGGDYGEELD